MDLKIEIICKETIKPSSLTPNHLKTHNLTVLDQFAPNLHVPLILFYPNKFQNSTGTSHFLKNSLQETLAHFYPLVGRAKDRSYIDCNDAGATYIETRITGNMGDVIKESRIEELRKLLPINPHQNSIKFVPEILLIHVNHFDCGGVAIGVCISRVIADASTVGSFVKCWATIARGDGCELTGVVIDCTSIFPPIDPQAFLLLNDLRKKNASPKSVVNNRFVFHGPKIDALRRKMGSVTVSSDLPTRFEALSALILGALMSIIEEKSEDYISYISVDLRKRMNPPLPQQCIGNVFQTTRAISLSNENGIDYNDLVRKIRESVRMINDQNVKRLHAAGGMLNFLKIASQEMGEKKASEAAGVVSFSSWCKFPFYEADFGWGKPNWVATALGQNKVAIFMDSRDGEGIEVWLGLHSELMSQFEQNSDVIEYASFIPAK